MSKLEALEPAMCCSTGVCGVSIDPLVVQFNADLQALTAQRRPGGAAHSLSPDAAASGAHSDMVKQVRTGIGRLPAVNLDGRIASTGMYPSRS